MAGAALLARAPDIAVETAGTLTIEGQPMSFRTRAALDAVGLEVDRHRSRQVTATDLDGATLIVGLAPEHVNYVRRPPDRHPQAPGPPSATGRPVGPTGRRPRPRSGVARNLGGGT